MKALSSFDAATGLADDDVLAGVQVANGGRKFRLADLATYFGGGGGGVSSFNTRTGAVTLTSGDVTTALTYTPQAQDLTLTALAGLAWSAGVQVPAFTAADTASLLTVGQASGNLLNKAAGDALYALVDHNHSGTYQPADAQLDSVAGLSYTGNAAKVIAVNAGESGFELVTASGGSDPWTVVKIAADFNNATATQADVTDGTTTLTFTPPANSDWEMEAKIMGLTTVGTNIPRIGLKVAAGANAGYGAVNIIAKAGTGSGLFSTNLGWDNPGSDQSEFSPAGDAPSANVPHIWLFVASGRSGSSPTAITITMACESAAASTCYIKRGSFLRHRTV